MDWGQVVNFSGGKGDSKGHGGKDKDSRDDRYERDQRDNRDNRPNDNRGSRDNRDWDDRSRGDDRGRNTDRGPPARETLQPPPPPRAPADQGLSPEIIKDLGRQFPSGALDMAHAINCELPKHRIGSLIGKKGAYVDQVEKDTGARVVFTDPPPGEKQEHRTMSITGPLISV